MASCSARRTRLRRVIEKRVVAKQFDWGSTSGGRTVYGCKPSPAVMMVAAVFFKEP